LTALFLLNYLGNSGSRLDAIQLLRCWEKHFAVRFSLSFSVDNDLLLYQFNSMFNPLAWQTFKLLNFL
jgi:hypothetical protein